MRLIGSGCPNPGVVIPFSPRCRRMPCLTGRAAGLHRQAQLVRLQHN
jgi:hypothetical protein